MGLLADFVREKKLFLPLPSKGQRFLQPRDVMADHVRE